MNNLFEKPIKDMSDDELMREVDRIPWEMVHIPIGELTKRFLNKLQKTIQEFNEQSSKQTQKMIRLTKWITVLTAVMVAGLLIQIYLAKIQVSPILSEQQRNERQVYELCKEYPEGDWPSVTGGKISCPDVLRMLKGKFE